MSSTDPWAFGLNHLLTIIGFAITLGIATAGFRSFAKWKREKIEERRIDIALEALALAALSSTKISSSVYGRLSLDSWQYSAKNPPISL